MVDTSPLQRVIEVTVPAAAAGVAQDQVIGPVPFSGAVSLVEFIPEADVTGAATNYRTFRVVNKGQDGNGTTLVASLPFSSGAVTATDFDAKAITLSGTPANLTVVAGDVLAWDETIAGTGLATPGGKIRVTIDRG